MNTPAHIILNLYVLKGDGNKPRGWSVMGGALLPDLPMFGFYFYEKVILHTPESVIWGSHYHLQTWQNFFNFFNSIPLAIVGLCLALWRKSTAFILFFSSILLHIAGDIFLHHDDAHAHFYPLSQWVFQSPVSYWDPKHHGSLVSLIELCGCIVLGMLLVRHFKNVGDRAISVFWLMMYFAYGIYVYFMWIH